MLAHTHDWQCNGAISKEVIIQVRKICSTAREEFDGGVNLCRKGILAFDHIEELLLLLLQVVDLTIEVLDYLGGAVDGDEGCDVVQRRVAGEEARVRGS